MLKTLLDLDFKFQTCLKLYWILILSFRHAYA
ncbi:unnamed protein product [Chironomus riparius]|uniref:Uncharacterized protein n=1 Tax=Chironomus riparius TaxID=315576 RepID=A0A9N9RMJ1_9DIPT|nr:unnamed protein product [Chironomus riparius]